MGFGGAASGFAGLAPYHLYLVGITVAVLGYAWYRQVRPAPAAAACCDVPGKKPLLQTIAFFGAVTALAALLLAFPYHGAKRYPTATPSAPAVAATGTAPIWQTRTYRIGGITCEACARQVERAVQQVTGVQTVAVSCDKASAQVRFDAAHAQAVQVERAINGTGYHVLSSTR